MPNKIFSKMKTSRELTRHAKLREFDLKISERKQRINKVISHKSLFECKVLEMVTACIMVFLKHL